MARSLATPIFVAALIINLLLLSQSRLTNVAVQQHNVQDLGSGSTLPGRWLFARDSDGSGENVRPHSPT